MAGAVVCLEVAEVPLTGVRLASGRQIPLRALAVAPRPVPHADFLTGLGPPTHPSRLGACIPVYATGLTAASGVWMAGNLADPNANAFASAASGSATAGAINGGLIAEDTRRAARGHRDRTTAPAGQRRHHGPGGPLNGYAFGCP